MYTQKQCPWFMERSLRPIYIHIILCIYTYRVGIVPACLCRGLLHKEAREDTVGMWIKQWTLKHLDLH